jgi:hypothetical protein
MNERKAAAPVHHSGSQPSSISSRNIYIIDSEQAAELARLMQQDRLLTEAMGGLLPEEGINLPERGHVLDLACGPDGWALELALASISAP